MQYGAGLAGPAGRKGRLRRAPRGGGEARADHRQIQAIVAQDRRHAIMADRSGHAELVALRIA